jgi:DNA-binding beta-propeller fold protein YncE
VGNAPGAIAVHRRSGHVFVFNGGDSTVSLLMAESMAVSRTIPVPAAYGVALAADEGRGQVFVVGAGNPGTVTTLDAHSGRVVRTVTVGDIGTTVATVAVDARANRLFVPNVWDRTVSVLDAATGRAVRTVGVGSGLAAVAVDGRRGHAFVATGNGTVRMLATRSGRVLRTVTVGLAPTRLAVDERSGRVVVLNDGDNRVNVLDAPTGALRQTVAIAGPRLASALNPAAIAVDERRGRAFVIHEPAPILTDSPLGRVSVLEVRSGWLQGTVAVGRVPAALALDVATARLFVVNTHSGCLPRPSAWALLPAGARRWLPFLPTPPGPYCAMPGSVTVIDASRL